MCCDLPPILYDGLQVSSTRAICGPFANQRQAEARREGRRGIAAGRGVSAGAVALEADRRRVGPVAEVGFLRSMAAGELRRVDLEEPDWERVGLGERDCVARRPLVGGPSTARFRLRSIPRRPLGGPGF